MNKCELCNFPATCYCESDDASLCWSCDRKVHGVNFLVARHIRTLLCRNCHSATPWQASGPNLGRTLSVCGSCANEGNSGDKRGDLGESEAGNDDFAAVSVDLAADSDGIKGGTPVVPLSPANPPPAVSSSSSSSCTSNQKPGGRSSCAESSVDGTKSLKRRPDDSADSSSRRMPQRRRKSDGGCGGGGTSALDSSMPAKRGSRSAADIRRVEFGTVDVALRRNMR